MCIHCKHSSNGCVPPSLPAKCSVLPLAARDSSFLPLSTDMTYEDVMPLISPLSHPNAILKNLHATL